MGDKVFRILSIFCVLVLLSPLAVFFYSFLATQDLKEAFSYTLVYTLFYMGFPLTVIALLMTFIVDGIALLLLPFNVFGVVLYGTIILTGNDEKAIVYAFLSMFLSPVLLGIKCFFDRGKKGKEELLL